MRSLWNAAEAKAFVDGNPQTALHKGTFSASAVMLVATYFIAHHLLPDTYVIDGTSFTANGVFFATVGGLIAGVLIGMITDYYTSDHSKPVQGIAKDSLTGSATNIIGGLAVGEPQEVMLRMLDTTCPELPEDKPRYLMGVGTPDDLLQSVARGVDMFDCVMPSRAGRHATAYMRFGRINLRNARHAEDNRPLDPESDCPASRDYSRAYLHHLMRSNEALGGMLLTWNNLAYYQTIMQGARDAIEAGRYADYLAETKEGWARGDMPAL